MWQTLTHLKLNYCRSINDLAIRKISEISKNLKQLDLNYCGEDITSEGVSYLERLEFLERLHLQEIDYIEIYTLCNILRNNRQMRDLNIAGVLIGTPTVDVVAIELKNSCPNLESINFEGENSITWQGIDALAECKNLQELNIGGCVSYNWSSDSFHRLLSSCQHLENINLGNFQGITDRDLTTLMLCKNLKYLDLSNILVPSDICSEILLKCSKLEKIDLYCTGIKKSLIDQWNEEYQHILIIHDNVV